MRYIPFEIPEFETLGLPEVIRTLAFEERGIVLITGTTGSGKSTTLASMIDMVNHAIAKHVVTIEDPIEFIHRDDKSIINQREVGSDTASFARALRRVLRQDPDVILIGRSGTPKAPRWPSRRPRPATWSSPRSTPGRYRDHKPPDRPLPTARAEPGAHHDSGHDQGHHWTASDPHESGYRAAVCEVMVTTGRIRDFIMDPAQTGQIEQAISEGEYYGMQTFDQALLKLVEEDRVDYEEAIRISSRPRDFKLMVYALGREEDAGESRDQDGPEVVRRGAPAAVDSRFRGNDE